MPTGTPLRRTLSNTTAAEGSENRSSPGLRQDHVIRTSAQLTSNFHWKSALASTYHSYKQTLGPYQHLQCMLCSPTQIAACHRHLYLAQARPHDAVSICLVYNIMYALMCILYTYNSQCIYIYANINIIGASLSEPHTYVKYATAVCMCIYIYIYIFIYMCRTSCRIVLFTQNGQDGRPLRRPLRATQILATDSFKREGNRTTRSGNSNLSPRQGHRHRTKE